MTVKIFWNIETVMNFYMLPLCILDCRMKSADSPGTAAKFQHHSLRPPDKLLPDSHPRHCCPVRTRLQYAEQAFYTEGTE